MAPAGPVRVLLVTTSWAVPVAWPFADGDTGVGTWMTTSGPTVKLRDAENGPAALPLLTRVRQ